MPGRKGSKKRKQTTCGGASSPRRGSRSRSVSPRRSKSVSPRRSRSRSASPKRNSGSRSVSPRRSRSRSVSPRRSRSANSNNMNNINRSPDYDAPYNYDAIHNILWTFKTNDPIKVTRALRHHINKENLDKFVVSLKSKPESKLREIHGWLDLDYIENRINTEEKLSKKEKEKKIKLFKDLKPKIERLADAASSREAAAEAIKILRKFRGDRSRR